MLTLLQIYYDLLRTAAVIIKSQTISQITLATQSGQKKWHPIKGVRVSVSLVADVLDWLSCIIWNI